MSKYLNAFPDHHKSSTTKRVYFVLKMLSLFIIFYSPITTNGIYPYTSGNGVTGTCQYVSGTGKVYDGSQTNFYGTTSTITNAAYQQVLSVSIQADQPVFQSYTGGIIIYYFFSTASLFVVTQK